jgi:hypothetical protein
MQLGQVNRLSEFWEINDSDTGMVQPAIAIKYFLLWRLQRTPVPLPQVFGV